jgi:hypothetical protein
MDSTDVIWGAHIRHSAPMSSKSAESLIIFRDVLSAYNRQKRWARGGADARTRTANRPITSRVTYPNSAVIAPTC